MLFGYGARVIGVANFFALASLAADRAVFKVPSDRGWVGRGAGGGGGGSTNQ